MEKSSPCLSTAGLLSHLLGLGTRGRKASVLLGSLGLDWCKAPRQRCCAALEMRAACALASAVGQALVSRPVSLCFSVHAAACVAHRAPALGTLLHLGSGQALSGHFTEEVHPAAVPGLEI